MQVWDSKAEGGSSRRSSGFEFRVEQVQGDHLPDAYTPLGSGFRVQGVGFRGLGV